MELTVLRTDARYLISPQLTSTEYPDVDLDRNLNRWYKTILGWIIPLQSDWEISGDILYHDLEINVMDIDLPLQLIRIFKGEIMYTTGGSFVPIFFRDIQKDQREVEGNLTRDEDDFNNPVADLIGDVLTIRPAPTEDVVNGIKLWVQMSLVDLSNSSDVPDFMEPVQRALSYGAALDFAIAEEMDKKSLEIKRLIYGDARVPNDTGVKGLIEELYSTRSGARRDRLTAKKTNYK
jgi:hypothetical protein